MYERKAQSAYALSFCVENNFRIPSSKFSTIPLRIKPFALKTFCILSFDSFVEENIFE